MTVRERTLSSNNNKLKGQKKAIEAHIKSRGRRKQARRDAKNA